MEDFTVSMPSSVAIPVHGRARHERDGQATAPELSEADEL